MTATSDSGTVRRGTVRKFGRPLAAGVTLDDLVLPRAQKEQMPFVLNTAQVEVGARLPLHSHSEREIWVITNGSGTLHRDAEAFDVCPGDVVLFQPGVEHELVNTCAEPIRLVSVYWS